MNVSEKEIPELLKNHKKITVYGLSPNPTKPSHSVPLHMKKRGFDVVGIYPGETDVAGIKIYGRLSEVPKQYLDFVNVFQRSEKIPSIVDEIIKLKATSIIWLQLGIAHPEAEKKAEMAGIKVISNRCIYIEWEKFAKLKLLT